jgi:hypothetical protein
MESKKFLLLSLQDLLQQVGYQDISIDLNLRDVWDDPTIDPVDFALKIENRYEIYVPDDIVESMAKDCTLDQLADKLLTIINYK